MKVLAVSAHPDDMEIEAGGTLAKMASVGHEVISLVLTNGAYTSTAGQAYTSAQLKGEAGEAAKILGIKEVIFLNNQTTNLKADSSTIAEVDKIVDRIKPDLLICLHQFDTHQDHRAVGEICLAVSRQGRVKNIICPVPAPYRPNSVGFKPQMFIDISPYIEQKLAAVKAYDSQYVKFGRNLLTDRIYCSAVYFGWGIDCELAEAFEVIRMDDTFLGC